MNFLFFVFLFFCFDAFDSADVVLPRAVLFILSHFRFFVFLKRWPVAGRLADFSFIFIFLVRFFFWLSRFLTCFPSWCSFALLLAFLDLRIPDVVL